ncbi:APC family permease [Streptomyces sp. NPDC056723]|uniref:APC family permease n=1 Tax=Streptomyces sp. NPDC056723 TaxID=3345925 RepID=UPI0036B79255
MSVSTASGGESLSVANEQGRMRRVLGIPSLLFFGLAYMVPLTVWTTYGVVTTSTGGHLPAAYVVTTLAMLLTAASYGRMVAAYPVAGSAYAYTRGAFGGKVGFLVGWVLLLDYLFLPMICYLVIGLYVHDYVPAVPMWVWIVGSVVAVTTLNVLGIKVITGVNLTVVVAQFIFIAIFVGLSVAKVVDAAHVPSFTAPFVSSGMNLHAVVAGSAVLALSFLGFDAVSTLSEETPDPTVRIPRAIVLCAVAGGGLYLLQAYVGHLVFPDFTAFANVDVATVDVMKRVGGGFLNAFFTAAYVAGCFACAAASQASVARILYAMGRDGVLPRRVFGRLHPRLLTPVIPNLIVGAFGLTALSISLATASSMISFGALAAFSWVNLSVVKHYVVDGGRRSARDLLRYLFLPVLGVMFSLYLWTSLSKLTSIVGLSWFGVGTVYLLVLTRGFTRQPPSLALDDHA